MSQASDVSDLDIAPEVDVIDGNMSDMSIEYEQNNEDVAETLDLPAEIVSLCSLSPTTVVAGCMDDNAYICRVDAEFKLQLVKVLSGHTDSVVDIVMNQKQAIFGTGSYDGTVKIYSSETFDLLETLEGPGSEIEFLKFDVTGESLMAGCSDGAVWVWQLSASKEGFHVLKQSVLSGHTDGVTGGLFLERGKALTISLDGSVIVWDLPSSKCLHRLRAPGQSPLVSMAPGRQAGTVLVGCDSGVLFAVSTENGKILNQVKASENSLESIAFNTDGSFLACGSTDGTLSIREASRLFTSAPRHKIDVGAGISSLMWHENENLVYVCTVGGEFAVFCPLTGTPVLRLQGGNDPMLAMCLGRLANGQSAVFTGGDDATLRMFALQLEEDNDNDELAKPAVP